MASNLKLSFSGAADISIDLTSKKLDVKNTNVNLEIGGEGDTPDLIETGVALNNFLKEFPGFMNGIKDAVQSGNDKAFDREVRRNNNRSDHYERAKKFDLWLDEQRRLSAQKFKEKQEKQENPRCILS